MKNKTLARVLELARPHKKTILITSMLSLLIGIGEIIKPYLIEIAIDEYIGKGIFQKGSITVAMIGAIYIGIVLLGNIIDFIATTTVNMMGEEVIYSLRNRLFKSLFMIELQRENCLLELRMMWRIFLLYLKILLLQL